MKLLNCTACHDVALLRGAWRYCACGKSGARYLRDGTSAEVWGHGRILGIDGAEYRKSLDDHRVRFDCFVMPDSHSRVRRVRRRP